MSGKLKLDLLDAPFGRDVDVTLGPASGGGPIDGGI